MASAQNLASSVGFYKNLVVALTLVPRKSRPLSIYFYSSQGEGFGKIPASTSQLLKGYEDLVPCCRPWEMSSYEMRCRKKCPTEPGNEDKTETETTELGQRLPIPHRVLRVMKVQLVPRGFQGVNRTGFCNMPQKKLPVSEPRRISPCVTYCMYWGRVTNSAGSWVIPTCSMGSKRFPT